METKLQFRGVCATRPILLTRVLPVTEDSLYSPGWNLYDDAFTLFVVYCGIQGAPKTVVGWKKSCFLKVVSRNTLFQDDELKMTM